VGCKTVHFRPGAGVEIESDAHLLAIDTKMAFTVAACFSALVKVTDMAPAALIWLYHNRDIDRKQALYEAFEGKHYLMEWLARVCAARWGRSGENSSGGLNARWIAMWPVRSLLHLVVMVGNLTGDESSIHHRNIALAPARELMSDPALSARSPLLDEKRYQATPVTGDPLELAVVLASKMN
jgi:hypothetical protein